MARVKHLFYIVKFHINNPIKENHIIMPAKKKQLSN